MADPQTVWESLRRVRESSPLIQNITNYVAMDVSANVLLAIGASPAMIHAEDEAAEFAGIASALVVNIGTLSPAWVNAMISAATRASELNKPWVLDPVGAGATAYRTEVALDLMRRQPTVLRGNASEILAVAGTDAAARGVDSVHGSDAALEAARSLATELNTTVVVSGEVDLITDGDRVVRIENGVEMMTRITALGCSATALIAAFCAVTDDPVEASAAAMGILGLCGDIAAEKSNGPGSLRVHIIDALYQLREADLKNLRIS